MGVGVGGSWGCHGGGVDRGVATHEDRLTDAVELPFLVYKFRQRDEELL